MAFARVVAFDGVPGERVAQMREEMNDAEPPEGLAATDLIVLHDGEERSLVLVFFDSEEDYAAGDAILDAMPAGDTPGRRTSVTKYEVVVRRSV
ncbi:MAG: hypothetical protein AB7V62_13885 [Thermoleophilia bacterium]